MSPRRVTLADCALAVLIGLALAALALQYFDILFL